MSTRVSTKDSKDATKPLLEEIRRLIKRSEYSQRRVEELAGFSKGYLSQLLAQNLDIKVWHVLAILEVFDVPPGGFFERIYPRRDALDEFADSSQPPSEESLGEPLGRLYRAGVASLTQLRRRLERCEQAVEQLEDQGLVDLDRAAAGSKR